MCAQSCVAHTAPAAAAVLPAKAEGRMQARPIIIDAAVKLHAEAACRGEIDTSPHALFPARSQSQAGRTCRSINRSSDKLQKSEE